MEKRYSIYISAFSGKNLQEAANILSRNFNIQVADARKILENVPVFFMSNLTKKEIRTLKGKLVSVSKYGVEFTISAQEVPYLAKVNYKGDGKQVAGVESNWYNLAFSCPHCKNLILLKPALQREVSEESHVKKIVAEQPEIEVESKEEILEKQPIVEGEQVVVEQELQTQEVEQQQDLQEEIGRGAEIQPENVLEEQVAPDVLAEEAAGSAIAEEPGETGVEAAQEEIIEIKEEMEEPEVMQVSVEQQEQESEQQEPVVVEEQPAVVEEQAPVVLEEEQPAVVEQEAPAVQTHRGIPENYTGPRYRVFVSNVTGEEKKEQAAQLVSELTGIPYEEAIEKFKKIIVPVFQEATEEQANNAITRFKELKIKATKTKIKS